MCNNPENEESSSSHIVVLHGSSASSSWLLSQITKLSFSIWGFAYFRSLPFTINIKVNICLWMNKSYEIESEAGWWWSWSVSSFVSIPIFVALSRRGKMKLSELFSNLYHGVWKSQKKSHSTLRAKRATFTFWVDKCSLKMPQNGPIWRVFENLKLAVKQSYQTGQF